MYNLTEILENAVKWAKEAGKIQLEYFRTSDIGIDTKSNISDVVTKVDKACEKYIVEQIRATYPDHGVLGEEGDSYNTTADWLWVIDPLDGTNNYSQGLPIFCVSIGIQYKGETQVGVVFAPYINELFTAIKGEGSFLRSEEHTS